MLHKLITGKQYRMSNGYQPNMEMFSLLLKWTVLFHINNCFRVLILFPFLLSLPTDYMLTSSVCAVQHQDTKIKVCIQRTILHDKLLTF